MSAPRYRRKIPYTFVPIPMSFFDGWFSVLTPNESAVYLAVFRLTWGYGRKERDTIAISQIAEMTGIPRRSIDRAISSLKLRGLLKITGSTKKPRLYEPMFIRYIPESCATAVAQEGGNLTPQAWRKPYATAVAHSIDIQSGPKLVK